MQITPEPGFMVSSLENSYVRISKVRKLLDKLVPNALDKSKQDEAIRYEEKINDLEMILQTLITFIKHVASAKMAIREDIKAFNAKSCPQDLVSFLKPK